MSERSSWWRRAGVFGSFALNLFLIGLLIGQASEHLDRPRAPAAPPGGLEQRVSLLPADEQQRFRLAMKPHRLDIAAARRVLKTAQDHLRETISAEPYDPAAVTAAFAAVRQATETVQTQVQQATVEALAELAPSSRAMLAHPEPALDSKKGA